MTDKTIKKYCSQCASILSLKCPRGDTCTRYVCDSCGYVDYENPKILVACFATFENKLLWMRRKYPPMAGHWFIPSGFMELSETPEEAASRELFEETRAIISPRKLEFFMIGVLPVISQVYLAYRGEIENVDAIQTTDESLEIGLFTHEKAPLDKLAFPITVDTFHLFYRSLAERNYGVYRAQVFDNKHVITALGDSSVTLSDFP